MTRHLENKRFEPVSHLINFPSGTEGHKLNGLTHRETTQFGYFEMKDQVAFGHTGALRSQGVVGEHIDGYTAIPST